MSNGEKQPVKDEKNLHKFKTTGQWKSEKSRKRSGLWFIHILIKDSVFIAVKRDAKFQTIL